MQLIDVTSDLEDMIEDIVCASDAPYIKEIDGWAPIIIKDVAQAMAYTFVREHTEFAVSCVPINYTPSSDWEYDSINDIAVEWWSKHFLEEV